MKKILVSLVLVLVLPALVTSAPPKPEPYRIDLELHPMAPFPFLSKFGSVDVSVFPGGVRADTLLVDAFSRVGTRGVTVENDVARTYFELTTADVRSLLLTLSGSKNEIMPGLPQFPVAKDVISGPVRGVPAKRYRVVLGNEAFIDVWTTTVVPKNAQFHMLETELLRTVSAPAASLSSTIPGMPIFVELNTRRFKKLPLLKLKQIVRSAEGEAEALSVGALMMKGKSGQNPLK